MIKIAAIVLNLIQLGFVGFLLATEGGAIHWKGWVLLSLMTALPLCNLFALVGLSGDNWLVLYFRRKALEGKKKVKELNDKTEP